jgi:hypothetical protein
MKTIELEAVLRALRALRENIGNNTMVPPWLVIDSIEIAVRRLTTETRRVYVVTYGGAVFGVFGSRGAAVEAAAGCDGRIAEHVLRS